MPVDRSTALVLAVAAMLPIAISVWAFLAWRRTKFTLGQALLMVVDHIICRVFWRLKTEGKFEDPGDTGALVICNHRSPFDPWFIACEVNRMVHWMVAREYCEAREFKLLFKILGSIPTSRSGMDTAAVRTAMRYVRAGELVGMLPEGRINTTDELLLPCRPGVAWVALKTKVPVIPCYIEDPPYDGSTIFGSLFRLAKVRLVIGKPMDISAFYGRDRDREALAELTKLMLQEIAKLAGREDYEAQLAGTNWKPEVD